MSSLNPLACERCGNDLEPDDAISIIEGVCGVCRRLAATSSTHSSAEMADFGAEADNLALSTLLDQLASAGDSLRSRGAVERERDGAAVPARLPAIPVVATPAYAMVVPRARRRARDLTVGAIIGLVLTSGATAYFILTRDGPTASLADTSSSLPQTLSLRVIPSWANIKLGGRVLDAADSTGRLTLSWSDQERWSWLEVSAEGYHPDRRPLATLGGAGDVCIELVRGPYEVSVQTTPDQTEVWIDGKLKGYSPLTVSLLPHERPTLSIKRRGYEEITQALGPPERSSQLDLKLTLTPRAPTVQVETDPPGAEVFAAGEPQGVSPLSLELAPSLLGQEVVITAVAAGHDTAQTLLTLPSLAVEPLAPVRLTLPRTRIAVEIATDPPGGTVLLDGQALGIAPVTAVFDPAQIGQTVVVQAALAGSHHGRRELTVPPAGKPVSLTVPMTFNTQRAVFVLSPSRDAPEASQALADRLIDLIHGLSPQQRFVLLACTDAGLEFWPGPRGPAAATSEQKVRAYDFVRSRRPGGVIDIRDALAAVIDGEPTALWLLTVEPLKRTDLQGLDAAIRNGTVVVHVIGAEAVAADEGTAQWVADHGGTFTIVGHDDAPVAFGEPDTIE